MIIAAALPIRVSTMWGSSISKTIFGSSQHYFLYFSFKFWPTSRCWFTQNIQNNTTIAVYFPDLLQVTW